MFRYLGNVKNIRELIGGLSKTLNHNEKHSSDSGLRKQVQSMAQNFIYRELELQVKQEKMSKNILYVEDNKDAVVFFKQIVNKLGDYNFLTTEDGVSAIKMLEEKQVEPEMILLDINLPGMNGFEILHHLRTKTSYKHIPVIMFSSSDDDRDIRKSYEFGANAYLIKPNNLHSMKEVLSDTFNFWLKHNVA